MINPYLPIFWQQRWIHQAYYGWRVVIDESNFRVLEKSAGPARRCLVLSALNSGDLDAKMQVAGIFNARTIVVLHDFHEADQSERQISGKKWRSAKDSERLLNIATFVIDLAQSEEDLWHAFGAKSRNVVRKAKESGLTVRLTETPHADLDVFDSLYSPVADRFQLAAVSTAKLRHMSENGDLLCLACVDPENRILAVNLVYMCQRQAIYLHGASVPDVAGGVGQLLQWETIRALRQRGHDWYDLGGLPSLDPGNGIHRFKKSIGGSLVHLGGEYIYTPPLLGGALACRSLARKLKQRIGRGKHRAS